MSDYETISMPKVSILIPVFNRKQFIAECIESALDQTYTDLEVVIVDNNSDDGTWEICQSFVFKDKRVRLFRNSVNVGPVRNWIRCATEAKGVFSKILFSDDLLEPNCLEEMVPALDHPGIALVYCAASIGSRRGKARTAYSLGKPAYLSSICYLNLLLRGEAPASPGAVLIRTSDLLANLNTDFPTATSRSYDQHGAGPDVMISILTADQYPFVTHLPTPLVYFRLHSGSFSIVNSGNQVYLSYRSVLSWYLLTRRGRQPWIRYLARGWLIQIKLDRKWVNLKRYLIEFEGKGSFLEQCVLSYYLFFYAAARLFAKKVGK
jgi:glycosyltransferase involved in cell wall biosynthesis